MRNNKDLTVTEFLVSQNIKQAIHQIVNCENPLVAKEYLVKALEQMYR